MVGGTASQQQQQQQQAPQLTHQSSAAAAAHTATSEEDEVLKRNTDCVYFLASPLTCKKGSECEYRHSDIARVNPRDCWYWLNGNCLNPKCAFRHPPLDGLAGSDMSTPKGPPPAPAPQATPYATPKQGVACIFFQKGYCLKGPLCPFLHGPPNSVNNKPAQPGPTNPVTEPPKMAQQVTVQKPVESLPPQAKQPPLPTRTGVDKKVAPPARVVPPVPPPVMNEPPYNKPNRSAYHDHHASNNERVVSGKDADEYSREISPGFDVLVDNEHEDSGPYFDVDHVDRDMYHEHREYDHYNERDGHFDVDHPEKRPYPRNDRENESDLRYRISKQRRGSDNGMRSGFNRESHADRMPRRDIDRDRDSRRDRLDQGSLSSRLRGRIKIPGRSVSPTRENNSRVEREVDVERRHHSRYSPGRPLSLNQSRVRDRINDTKFAGPKRLSELKGGRTEHQPNDDQSLRKRKHTKMEDDVSFEGPKPLSEILKRKRGVNNGNNNNDDSNNNNNVNNNNYTEDDNQKKIEIVPANKEERHSASVDTDAENEKDKPTDGTVKYGVGEVENEGGMVDEDALLDEELEAYDENRDGDDEYEYEQMEGEEDYNMEEGEEEEYVDEEDVVEGEGDEYGNKEGAVYS